MLALTGLLLAVSCDEAGESALRGENAVTRAQAALAAGDANDPMLRMRLGRAYGELGQDDAALKEYLWCFDEGEQHAESFHGVRLSFLLGDIEELSRRYPPAMAALIERRRAAEQRIVDGSASYDDVAVFSSINETLDENESTIVLCGRVKDSGLLAPVTLQALVSQCFHLLVDAKHYERVVAEYDPVARAERAFVMYETTTGAFAKIDALVDGSGDSISDDMRREVARIAADEELQEQVRQSLRDMLLWSVVPAYQALIGASLFDEAAGVGDRLVGSLDDANTRNALAWAGYLTGSPIEANVNQAREAFAMTSGEDLAIVDTLARLLATRGERDAAVEIARSGLERAKTKRDRERMQACLDYCQDSRDA